MAKNDLNRADLNTADRARLQRVLGGNPEVMSEGDRNFIMSRRDYLTKSELSDMEITPAAVKAHMKEEVED